MTFEKAMQLLLKGKRLYVPGWSKNHYIRLADSTDTGAGIVTEDGNTYEMYAADYYYDWKVFENSYKAGDLLAYEDKVYRIIKHGGKYDLVNTNANTWKVVVDNIDEKELAETISELDLVKF